MAMSARKEAVLLRKAIPGYQIIKASREILTQYLIMHQAWNLGLASSGNADIDVNKIRDKDNVVLGTFSNTSLSADQQ
jgi:hypothetical protein